MTKPKERPILFSGPMVRAILQGRKTQTRRIVKGDPATVISNIRTPQEKLIVPEWWFSHCPYGKPGDRLWVRETFRLPVVFDKQSPRAVGEKCVDAGYRKPWAPVRYEADGDDKFLEMLHDFGGEWGKTRVSIHIPRWLSRITLEITGVRVERLQDISEADAIAEGAERPALSATELHGMPVHPMTGSYVDGFRNVWQSINGPESWAANPWVWVVEFAKVDALTAGGDA